MAPQQGFICNTATMAGITTTYALARILTLNAGTDALAIDANAKALPSGGYLSHIEILLDETVATVATATVWLSWDAAGDVAASSEATITLVSGLTDVSRRMGATGLDVWPSWNDNRTYGSLYLWVRTDAGTATLLQARLYWRDHLSG